MLAIPSNTSSTPDSTDKARTSLVNPGLKINAMSNNMKMKIVNLAVLMTLLITSGVSFAKGGDPTSDDNPSASDLYVLQYGAEKQNDSKKSNITEAELETIKVTPPPAPTP